MASKKSSGKKSSGKKSSSKKSSTKKTSAKKPSAKKSLSAAVTTNDHAAVLMAVSTAASPANSKEAAILECLSKCFFDNGLPQVSPSPDALREFVASEIVRWGAVVQKAGIAGSE